MTTWRSNDLNYRELSRGARFDRLPAVDSRHWRGFERRTERIVASKGLEVRIVSGESPIFGIQGDGAFEVCDGFGRLAALRMSNGQHVERVVVIGILVADQSQVGDGFVVPPPVDGDRGGVEPLVDRLR